MKEIKLIMYQKHCLTKKWKCFNIVSCCFEVCKWIS